MNVVPGQVFGYVFLGWSLKGFNLEQDLVGLFFGGILRHNRIPDLSIEKKVIFLSRIRTGKPFECWEWVGIKSKLGYGIFHLKSKGNRTRNYFTHRVSFFLFNNKDPGDKLVCHSCDNTSCANPLHLFLGTPLDNIRDAKAKSRLHQPKGSLHPRTKLTEKVVLDIRKRCSLGQTQLSLAKEFKMDPSSINSIITKRSWSHI